MTAFKYHNTHACYKRQTGIRNLLPILDLQHKFRVSNTNLVSIDLEEFWYRTTIYRSISKYSGIEPAIYRSISKNYGIEPAIYRYQRILVSNEHYVCCILLGTVFYMIKLTTSVSSIEPNSGIDRYRIKPGIEPALIYIISSKYTFRRTLVYASSKYVISLYPESSQHKV